MTAKLITHEPNNDRTFEVSEAGLTIGRHTDNNASLDDSRLSRFHARITFRDGAWYAEDLGSTNGSFINDKRFQGEVKVNPGDKLRFGATDAELVWTDEAVMTPPPVAEPKKTSLIQPLPGDATQDAASLKTAATIVAPLSSLLKQVPAQPASPSPVKPVKLTPLAPAEAAQAPAPVKHVVLTPISPAAPAAAPVKPLVITPASPEEIAALDGAAPEAPAAAAKPAIRKPVIGGGLRPGLKLPPKAPALKAGLKLPPKPAGLKPGLKLPPKPGAAPAK